jgi:hypothetical protein
MRMMCMYYLLISIYIHTLSIWIYVYLYVCVYILKPYLLPHPLKDEDKENIIKSKSLLNRTPCQVVLTPLITTLSMLLGSTMVCAVLHVYLCLICVYCIDICIDIYTSLCIYLCIYMYTYARICTHTYFSYKHKEAAHCSPSKHPWLLQSCTEDERWYVCIYVYTHVL